MLAGCPEGAPRHGRQASRTLVGRDCGQGTLSRTPRLAGQGFFSETSGWKRKEKVCQMRTPWVKDSSVLILSSHPARRSDFGYTIFANAKRGAPQIAEANRFPAQGWSRSSRPVGSRVLRDRTVGRSSRDRRPCGHGKRRKKARGLRL